VGIGFVSNTDKKTDVRPSGADTKHKVDIMYYYYCHYYCHYYYYYYHYYYYYYYNNMIPVLGPDFSAREIRAAKKWVPTKKREGRQAWRQA
jgi:hypothetical protein